MSQPSDSAGKPSVLFVYFSYTKQTLKVVEAMAEVLRGRGCDMSYLGSGEYRERYLGIKIPPTNLQEHHLEEARKFAGGLAGRLLVSTGEPR
jgi:flavodoxin